MPTLRVFLLIATFCPASSGSKLARPLVIAGTVAAGAAAYGNRDKHAAGPLAVAAAVNGAVIALSLFLIKPLETEIEVRIGALCAVKCVGLWVWHPSTLLLIEPLD